MTLSRLIPFIALAVVAMSGVALPRASAQAADNASRLAVTHEDARTFKVSRPNGPDVRVTFLTAPAFRVHVLTDDDTGRLIDYMRVKSDASYPEVAVEIETSPDSVQFSTSAIVLRLTAENRILSLSARAGTASLIENWKIDSRAHTAQLDLRATEHIYGFGDKRAALDQRGQRIEMINRDAYASEGNDSYKSIPFYMSSAGYGLFFHNYQPSVFDIGASSASLVLNASGGAMDFYVFIGDFKDILAQYTELTGRPAMLPRWAFGYHQGKASYDDDDAFTVAREMRRRKLPVDVIYYDDWVDEATTKHFVTSLWNRHHVRLTMGFGMPMFGSFEGVDDSAFLKELATRGFLMVDRQKRPVIGPDQYVDDSMRNSAVGYLDYFSPRAVDYVFASRWERAIKNGTILGMVDFGEMDKIADLENKFWPSLGISVAKTRNLFGLVYPLSIMNGVIARGGSRSTGMVRPGYAGTQRLGWTTTGDSYPGYANFRAHTRGMINLSLSGFSNIGQDIGGWSHKGEDTIYARWFAAGTFHPFMWSHGQGDHEPYSHGATVEKAARALLNLRYRLVPYLYSLHEAAHRTGVPMLRALAVQEQADEAAARIDDQYFIGDNLMIAPLFDDHGNRKLYLPKGLWYDFFGELPPEHGARTIERTSVPLDRLPVYVREGAIIPLGPVMQHTSEKPVDPLSVHVYGFAPEDSVAARSSEASLYEDDGLSNKYQHGEFARTHLRYRQTRATATFKLDTATGDGKFRSAARNYRVHFHGLAKPVRVRLDGQDIPQAGASRPRGAGSKASWSADAATGEISIVIPPAEHRAVTVELDMPQG
jgi:alpha-glucosidase